MIEPIAIPRMRIIVVHLETPRAHDLEPVHHALHARERVQVRVRRELLVRRDVLAEPVEEENERGVDYANEDRRVCV